MLANNQHIKLWLVLDNIRSAYNVGAIFRTADGTGITGLVLLGITPDPKKQVKVHKTALGAEDKVPYIYYKNADIFVSELNKLHLNSYLGALELTSTAINLFEWQLDANIYTNKTYFIAVGHELLGVSSKILVESEFHLQIPMHGFKESLNVAESSSILMYEFYRKYYKLGC